MNGMRAAIDSRSALHRQKLPQKADEKHEIDLSGGTTVRGEIKMQMQACREVEWQRGRPQHLL